jgi:hypothetical protein
MVKIMLVRGVGIRDISAILKISVKKVLNNDVNNDVND